MESKYRVQVRNAAGVDRYIVVHGRTEQQACDRAVKSIERETGERWYAVCTLTF
jgi:hypothetical protein